MVTLTVTDHSTPTHLMGTSSVSLTVSPAPTTTSVNCAPSTVSVGSTSTCTATVIGYPSGGATGTVTFSQSGGSGKTALIKTPQECTLVGATCQVTVSATGQGGVDLSAVYSGDTNNVGSTGQAILTISAATSVTTVVCAPATVTAGEPATCTATVRGYAPTGSVTWSSSDTAGIFSANPCTLSTSSNTGSCGVSYTATSSAQITAVYAGDGNNSESQGSFAITANVQETIQITVANSGPTAQVTLSGCEVSPTTISADGIAFSFTATSGCSGIVATLPPAGQTARYLTASDSNSLSIPSCSSSSCRAFSATIYYQLLSTYQAAPKSPSSWSTAGMIPVTGTSLGTPGQSLCVITVSTGAGEFSCQGWGDFDTQVTMGPLQVSQNERWATGEGTFTNALGGSVYSGEYFSQVLEDFQYSVVGSASAPAAPTLDYTGFGANSTIPLTGSESLVWMDTGSSWSAPLTIAGSTSTERWEGTIGSGAATAGQTETLTYYHQFMITFGYSVVGGGSAYVSPLVQFTSFGVPQQASQGWVDAGSTFSFTNPLDGSTATERWFTPTESSVASAAGAASAVYYHQYAFALNFTVTGGGTYDNPRLNFTYLGQPEVDQVNATSATAWIDAGAKWAVSTLLPNSSPTERWVTNVTTSGTSSAPVARELPYYHQYLGTLRYAIVGTGGSPPVPDLNYTSLESVLLAPLGMTPNTYWMDSGSVWGVTLSLPGVHGERWLSNVSLPEVASAPFSVDVQYQHQFYLEAGVSTPAGGQVANPDQWEDQGTTVVLNATAAHSWAFVFWNGTTGFSYNGTTRLGALDIKGPANETAVFFPGLLISSNKEGSVAYSYGTVTGTVEPGTNATIYPPPGRNVTLIAMPKTVSIMFQGWTGALTDSHLKSFVAITSPQSAQASFATDYTDIRTFAIATLGIFIAACYIFVLRRGFTPKIRQ